MNVRDRKHEHTYDAYDSHTVSTVTFHNVTATSCLDCPAGHADCVLGYGTTVTLISDISVSKVTLTSPAILRKNVRDKTHRHSYRSLSVTGSKSSYDAGFIGYCPAGHPACDRDGSAIYSAYSSISVSKLTEESDFAPPAPITRSKKHNHSFPSDLSYSRSLFPERVGYPCDAGHDNCKFVTSSRWVVTGIGVKKVSTSYAYM